MKVLVVDDHAVVRDGLRRLLLTLPNVEIFEAANGRDALSLVQRQSPDLVLLDLQLPGIGGIELLRRLVGASPHVRVLVFSMHAEKMYAARALQAGARGYVSKNASPEELQLALRRVLDGGRYVEREIAQELAVHGRADADPWNQLTERDLEILRLLSEGRSLAQIAAAIGLSYKTVANTCTQIKAKLGVTRTADLVRLSIEMGVS
ncbi:MAG TPA: response regulator transcription factor [Steroidobacteraceae bacterium]|nr:response regulator transcription factor [Steroidobacteraceae bacterium]